jgi:hypothetical protein
MKIIKEGKSTMDQRKNTRRRKVRSLDFVPKNGH